jgi:hypothetical protein
VYQQQQCHSLIGNMPPIIPSSVCCAQCSAWCRLPPHRYRRRSSCKERTGAVSWAFPSWNRFILTEIYLLIIETEDGNVRAGVDVNGVYVMVPAGDDGAGGSSQSSDGLRNGRHTCAPPLLLGSFPAQRGGREGREGGRCGPSSRGSLRLSSSSSSSRRLGARCRPSLS